MAETTTQAAQTPTDQLEIPKQQVLRKNIKSMEQTEVQLVDNDLEKTALIGATLDPK